MILTYKEAERNTKYLFETRKIDEIKYRMWISEIYRWGRDCEYEIVEYLPGQWEMKPIPLMQIGYR